MSNSLDPYHAQQFVGPDLGPNSLTRLSAEDTGRQRINVLYYDEEMPLKDERMAISADPNQSASDLQYMF